MVGAPVVVGRRRGGGLTNVVEAAAHNSSARAAAGAAVPELGGKVIFARKACWVSPLCSVTVAFQGPSVIWLVSVNQTGSVCPGARVVPS